MCAYRAHNSFEKVIEYLKKQSSGIDVSVLKPYAEQGLSALSKSTPVDTGKTANSWSYEIQKTKNQISITYYNSNVVNGVNIAVILQYGHGTKNGGWVEGIDYINPAIKPVFNEIADAAWKEVTKT